MFNSNKKTEKESQDILARLNSLELSIVEAEEFSHNTADALEILQLEINNIKLLVKSLIMYFRQDDDFDSSNFMVTGANDSLAIPYALPKIQALYLTKNILDYQ